MTHARQDDGQACGTLVYVGVALPSGRSHERGFVACDGADGGCAAALMGALAWLREFLPEFAGPGVRVDMELRVDGVVMCCVGAAATDVLAGAWDNLLDED